MRVAIVHEWLNVYGGAERLLAEILCLLPQAQVYALIHNPRNLLTTPLEGRAIKTSFLQNIPGVEHLYRVFLPLMPLAIESLDLRDYPLVISISHAVAHGVKTAKDQTHVSYVCTPMRYAWHLRDDYLRLHHLDKPPVGALARLMLGLLRRWDRAAANRADHLLAISQWTACRIQQVWGREARVIYPPVDVARFHPAARRDDYYLLVSRLVPYKMAGLIVEAFNRLRLPLIIVGDGPELPRLRRIAYHNIQFLGRQPDAVVADLMGRAKAFVHMATEDFGIAMVEAQAAGCPVIAYARGGAAEVVQEGKTGVFVPEQSVKALMDAVVAFEAVPRRWQSQVIRSNALRFSRPRFRQEFMAFLEKAIGLSLPDV